MEHSRILGMYAYHPEWSSGFGLTLEWHSEPESNPFTTHAACVGAAQDWVKRHHAIWTAAHAPGEQDQD